MADVFTAEGKAYLQDPLTGKVIAVPEAEAEASIEAGALPADEAGVRRARSMEHYGTGGMAILAGLAGAGRGLTLGLSDAALTKTGLVAPETLAGLKEANPSASLAGDVIGTAGSFFIPGAPAGLIGKGAARVGRAAAEGSANVLGRSVGSALPRLAEAGVREGLTGLALGAGAGITDVTLSSEPMSSAEAAARILGSAGRGGLAGLGVGSLTWLAKTGAIRAGERYTLGMERIKALRTEKSALEAEAAAAKASGESAERLVQLESRLGAVAQDLHGAQVAAVGKVFQRAAAYSIGHVIGGGLSGGLLGVLVAPTAIKTLRKALSGTAGVAASRVKASVEPYLGSAWAKVAGTAERAWEHVAPYVERVAESPIGKAVAGTAVSALESKTIGGAAAKRINFWKQQLEATESGAVPILSGQTREGMVNALRKQLAKVTAEAEAEAAAGVESGLSGLRDRVSRAVNDIPSIGNLAEGVARASTAIPDPVISGAMLWGPGGAVAGYAAHRFSQSIGRGVELLAQHVAPPARTAVIDALTKADWQRIGEELRHVAPDQIDAAVRASLPESTPPDAVSAVSERLQRGVGFLQKLQSNTPPEAQIPTGAPSSVDEMAQGRFQRAMRSVVKPDTLISSFADGKLSRDQVEAWQVMYPEALAQLRAVVSAEVAAVKASGGTYSRERAAQVATLLGVDSAAPVIYSPRAIARISRAHKAARGGGSDKPMRGATGPVRATVRPSRFSIAASRTTPMQRLSGGR